MYIVVYKQYNLLFLKLKLLPYTKTNIFFIISFPSKI